jgi:Zn-finger nucleic acid-binding protein
MKSYERNRILVDQCTGCGGLFLDKGELEQLAAAENAWHSEPAAQSQPRYDDRRPDDRSHHDDRHDDRHRDDRSGYDDRRDGSYKPRKKKSSFLADLFEG